MVKLQKDLALLQDSFISLLLYRLLSEIWKGRKVHSVFSNCKFAMALNHTLSASSWKLYHTECSKPCVIELYVLCICLLVGLLINVILVYSINWLEYIQNLPLMKELLMYWLTCSRKTRYSIQLCQTCIYVWEKSCKRHWVMVRKDISHTYINSCKISCEYIFWRSF